MRRNRLSAFVLHPRIISGILWAVAGVVWTITAYGLSQSPGFGGIAALPFMVLAALAYAFRCLFGERSNAWPIAVLTAPLAAMLFILIVAWFAR